MEKGRVVVYTYMIDAKPYNTPGLDLCFPNCSKNGTSTRGATNMSEETSFFWVGCQSKKLLPCTCTFQPKRILKQTGFGFKSLHTALNSLGEVSAFTLVLHWQGGYTCFCCCCCLFCAPLTNFLVRERERERGGEREREREREVLPLQYRACCVARFNITRNRPQKKKKKKASGSLLMNCLNKHISHENRPYAPHNSSICKSHYRRIRWGGLLHCGAGGLGWLRKGEILYGHCGSINGKIGAIENTNA